LDTEKAGCPVAFGETPKEESPGNIEQHTS